MGTQHLLPLLSHVATDFHISSLKGKTVAVDGQGLLLRGAFALTYEDYLDGEEAIPYFKTFLNLFSHYQVNPVIVFDGLTLPLKVDLVKRRNHKRAEALYLAEQLYAAGLFSKANKYYRRSISITSTIIQDVIKELRKIKVQCIVAPYEADAQLAYLMKTNKVDAVITQDSHHLAFGCPKVIFNFERDGSGKQILLNDIFRPEHKMEHLNPTTFRHASILSGCDYLPCVPGTEFKTVVDYYEGRRTTDRVIDGIFLDNPDHFPHKYWTNFDLADIGFLYQWVYDPDLKNYVRMNPVPSTVSDTDLLVLGHQPSPSDLAVLRVNKINRARPAVFNQEAPSSPIAGPSTSAASGSVLSSPNGSHQASSTKRKAESDTDEEAEPNKRRQITKGKAPIRSSPSASNEPRPQLSLSEYLYSIKEDIDPMGVHFVFDDKNKPDEPGKKGSEGPSVRLRGNSHLLQDKVNGSIPSAPASIEPATASTPASPASSASSASPTSPDSSATADMAATAATATTAVAAAGKQ